MRTLVISDIHGSYKALEQVLQRCNFDYENDQLICCGDVCDGWPDTKKCIDELLKIKNLIYILGNHDEWTRTWMTRENLSFFRDTDEIWLTQGGTATVKSYLKNSEIEILQSTPEDFDIPESHINFLKNARYYYIDSENRGFVHAGCLSADGLPFSTKEDCIWTRLMWQIAMSGKKTETPKILRAHKEWFIGHTPTLCWEKTKPMNACNVWNMDTGASYNGSLSIMDVNTKEVWQSEPVVNLYPGIKAR